MATFSTASLRTELTADPRGYGYAAPLAVPNDQAAADLLNAVRDGTNPGATPTAAGGQANGAIPVRRSDVESKAIWEAINVADMAALPANPSNAQLSNERRQLAWLSGLPNIPQIRLLDDAGNDTPVVANLRAAFAAGSPTIARLVALATRSGSRAEELWGAGFAVTAYQVSQAR
jgi:hypothetical protein